MILMMLFREPLGISAAIRALIHAHPISALILIALVGFAILNAAVQAMEKPTERNGAGYRYLYRFAHLLCFNFQYALKAKFPQYVPAAEPLENQPQEVK